MENIKEEKGVRDVLARFKDWKRVENEEYDVLKPYSAIGVVKFGFSFKKREIRASLTNKGKRLMGLK